MENKELDYQIMEPNSFEPENHFYPRVLNAQIHPMVSAFMTLGQKRIAKRYCHLHPSVDHTALLKLLNYHPAYFRWAGSDLFNVTNTEGIRQMVVVETNSCPSGQKSMPSAHDDDDSGGYARLLGHTFVPYLKAEEEKGLLPKGVLAVIYDKNFMESSGYAAELATLMNEKVYLVKFYNGKRGCLEWRKGVLYLTLADGKEVAIRAAWRYVTQKPWNRIPLQSKTLILNPIVACITGGRNKMMAAKAYDLFNAAMSGTGLQIRVPETIKDVSKAEVPLYVKSFGGHAVVKVPYSNAGQGVYTITSEEELENFMKTEGDYDAYIIQSLVGNAKWSSVSRAGTFYHVGTVPNKRMETFVGDIRCMVGSTSKGFEPIAVYARRAHTPLVDDLKDAKDSWSMLGTNLSVKLGDNKWDTETNRLLLMDRRDFNKLGIGMDDLIDAYVQTCMCAVSIDKMCKRLFKDDGTFDLELFSSLNSDDALLDELFTDRRRDLPDEDEDKKQ